MGRHQLTFWTVANNYTGSHKQQQGASDLLLALPEESMTLTGSTSNSLLQYCENIVHMVLRTIWALVISVPVHSMNTSVVSIVICTPVQPGEAQSLRNTALCLCKRVLVHNQHTMACTTQLA